MDAFERLGIYGKSAPKEDLQRAYEPIKFAPDDDDKIATREFYAAMGLDPNGLPLGALSVTNEYEPDEPTEAEYEPQYPASNDELAFEPFEAPIPDQPEDETRAFSMPAIVWEPDVDVLPRRVHAPTSQSVHAQAAMHLREIIKSAGGSMQAKDALGELAWYGYDYDLRGYPVMQLRKLAGVQTSGGGRGRPAMWSVSR